MRAIRAWTAFALALGAAPLAHGAAELPEGATQAGTGTGADPTLVNCSAGWVRGQLDTRVSTALSHRWLRPSLARLSPAPSGL